MTSRRLASLSTSAASSRISSKIGEKDKNPPRRRRSRISENSPADVFFPEGTESSCSEALLNIARDRRHEAHFGDATLQAASGFAPTSVTTSQRPRGDMRAPRELRQRGDGMIR